MAANPISATEIKSRWRQRSSPSLTNNDSAFGVFMKMMDQPKRQLKHHKPSHRLLMDISSQLISLILIKMILYLCLHKI